MLPKPAIDEFKKIYLQEEGVRLSEQEATVLCNSLMSLFKSLAKQVQSSNLVQSVGLTKNSKKLL
jgi:hypothetical protein